MTFRKYAVKWLTLQKAAHNRKGSDDLICLGLYESGWGFRNVLDLFKIQYIYSNKEDAKL